MTVRARVCRRHSKQAPLAVLFVADDGRDEHSETGCSRRFDWCKPHPGRVIGVPTLVRNKGEHEYIMCWAAMIRVISR